MKDFIDLKEFTLYDRAGKQYDFKEGENGDFDAWIGTPDNRRVYLTVSKERLTKDIAIGELRVSQLPAKSLSEWINSTTSKSIIEIVVDDLKFEGRTKEEIRESIESLVKEAKNSPPTTIEDMFGKDEEAERLERIERNQKRLAQMWETYLRMGFSFETKCAIEDILKEMEGIE